MIQNILQNMLYFKTNLKKFKKNGKKEIMRRLSVPSIDPRGLE